MASMPMKGAMLDQPPPLPPDVGRNDMSVLAGQQQPPQQTPVGVGQSRALMERTELALKVIQSLGEIDPRLAGMVDQLSTALAQAVMTAVGGAGPQGSVPAAPVAGAPGQI